LLLWAGLPLVLAHRNSNRHGPARFAPLLSKYGESHQNPTNKLVHWVCVPLIMFSLIGLLWSVPVPAFIRNLSPWLN